MVSLTGICTAASQDVFVPSSVRNNTTDTAIATNDHADSLPPSSAALPDDKVTLGATSSIALVYAKPFVVTGFEPTSAIAWSKPTTDDISQLIQKNSLNSLPSDWAGLLNGLGEKLLNGIAGDAENYQQTMVVYEPKDLKQELNTNKTSSSFNSHDIVKTSEKDALIKAQDARHSLGMKILTKTGKEIEISISFDSDNKEIRQSLSVSVSSSDKLTADERKAIAKLSSGFEKALQDIANGAAIGLGASQSPDGNVRSVDISGLLNYDAAVLSGVDLNYLDTSPADNSIGKYKLKSLDFHADAKQRSFSMKTDANQFSVKVDLSRPELWGTQKQQQAAIQQYFDQFDSANSRAHSEKEIVEPFKNVFGQLHSTYPTNGKENKISHPAYFDINSLNDKDRSVLSGLGDFQASMSGKFTNKMPAKITKFGQINFQIAQSTEVQGTNKISGLSITQIQKSSLNAEVLQSRNGMMLDTESGNYDSYSIQDIATQKTEMTYKKDKLILAVVTNQVKQWEKFIKLVNHKAEVSQETPLNKFTQKDISALLHPSP